jgi:hypothetical protein
VVHETLQHRRQVSKMPVASKGLLYTSAGVQYSCWIYCCATCTCSFAPAKSNAVSQLLRWPQHGLHSPAAAHSVGVHSSQATSQIQQQD